MGTKTFLHMRMEKLSRQRGYYIFYERNEAMQRYMVDHGGGESVDEKEEFEDRATKSFPDDSAGEERDIRAEKSADISLYCKHISGDGCSCNWRDAD